MSNSISCHSLDDLPIETLSRIIGQNLRKTSSLQDFMYEAGGGGGDPQVFRTTSLHMIEGMGPKYLNADLFIRTCALHNNIEAMFRQGMCY
uniref:Uncharacterized protein n=1 Tax=Lactuca sativa TaxID=4236 RepID=A0A9R1VQT5_LACSA|nr:hypothetical protein LSAT_V11C400196440 [Lactuca sativa]